MNDEFMIRMMALAYRTSPIETEELIRGYLGSLYTRINNLQELLNAIYDYESEVRTKDSYEREIDLWQTKVQRIEIVLSRLRSEVA